MTVIINIRNPHHGDTFIARAAGFGRTASTTHSAAVAVEHCAMKVAAGRPFTLKKVTELTWLAEIVDPADAPPTPDPGSPTPLPA